MGFFAHFAGSRQFLRGVFYINPSRRGPVPAFFAFSGSEPGEARGAPKWGFFREIPGNRGLGSGTPGGVSGVPRDGDRAPPRGVDVKPPSAARSRRDTRALGAHSGHPAPPGPPDPVPDPLGPSQGPGEPSRASRSAGFYINPSRRGPAPGPGSRGLGSLPSSGGGGRGRSLRPVQGLGDPSGVERGRAARRA